jgi:transcription elongation factor GreB
MSIAELASNERDFSSYTECCDGNRLNADRTVPISYNENPFSLTHLKCPRLISFWRVCEIYDNAELRLLLSVECVRLRQYPLSVSKAFTRESDENDGEEIPSGRFQLPPGAKNYITREGADRLRQNLNELLEKKRIGANGGNNADPETKAEQRRIESAIRKVQSILDSVIVAESPADSGKVGFGASVRIRYRNGEEETYQIVGTDEAEACQGRISASSPLAQALMNSKVGDTVCFKSPSGDQELTVLAVHY